MDNQFLILTATRRLAQALRRADDQQHAQQQPAWETPQIMPLPNWLQALWYNYGQTDERILSEHQEQELWFQLLDAARQDSYPLLHVENTVLLMQQAWQLLSHWLVPLERLRSGVHSAEVQLFVDCATQFSDYCRQQGWFSQAELPQRALATLTKAQLPKQIIIAGFDELFPAYQQLLQALRPLTILTILKSKQEPTAYYKQTFTDIEAEITAMAAWAKQQIEKNPQQKCGCIVPQLTQHRAQVAHIFKRVLAASAAFNISVGQRLHEFPLIATGLKVLALDAEKIATGSLSELLQSPYLCQSENDAHLGAMLDAECRRLGDFELRLAAIYAATTKWQSQYPEQTWLKRWRAWAANRATRVGLQLPSQWADYFTAQLTAIGWPGGRSLNSLEYQLFTHWQQLLMELAGLDVITGVISHASALNRLQRLAAQTIFQPQTEADNPIQILGTLESNGFDFDTLWIMGLEDQHWPPPAQPNPFLPYSLQVQAQMPQASPQQELRYARLIMQRLCRSANAIWLSCSAADTDQVPQFSQLIQQQLIHAYPTGWDSSTMQTAAKTILASAQQEHINDAQGPAISSAEKVSGGSAILTRQAECPFRAFAIFRLKAVALTEPEIGISPQAHGVLVHYALERIWKTLQNQQRLLAISTSDLAQLVERSVDEALREILSIRATSTFAQIEKQRLLTLLQDWLTLEKQRPPFAVVEQESECRLELGGLSLSLKIDRIDRLSDGSRLLIDYKTGMTQLRAWLNERLQQPQLPLYALAANPQQPFSGIAFAQLLIGKLSFKGLHCESLETATYFPDGILRIDNYSDLSIPKNWSALLTYWREILTRLAADFQNGYAAVDPAEQGAPCRVCDLQVLCRVHPNLGKNFSD